MICHFTYINREKEYKCDMSLFFTLIKKRNIHVICHFTYINRGKEHKCDMSFYLH